MQHYPALPLHQAEVELIQSKLAAFLPPRQARELTMQIYDLALDIDEDIDGILQDPSVQKLYEYDGRFFTPRDRGGFHTVFNGLHILRSLGNFIDIFFKARPRRSAIRWLLDELRMHRWVAKRRRMNWEEFGTLGLIPDETIQEIMEAQRRAELDHNPPPLAAEEQAFFKSFEEQLERINL